MRPNPPAAVVKGSRFVGAGAFGNAVSTLHAAALAGNGVGFALPLAVKQSDAGALMVDVFRFLPSKLSESSTTFRYAISVTTAPDARITDLPGPPKTRCRIPES